MAFTKEQLQDRKYLCYSAYNNVLLLMSKYDIKKPKKVVNNIFLKKLANAFKKSGFILMCIAAVVSFLKYILGVSFLTPEVFLFGGPITMFLGGMFEILGDATKAKVPYLNVENAIHNVANNEYLFKKELSNELSYYHEFMAYDIDFPDDKSLAIYKSDYEKGLKNIFMNSPETVEEILGHLEDCRELEKLKRDDSTVNSVDQEIESLCSDINRALENCKNTDLEEYKKYLTLYNNILLAYQQKIMQYEEETLKSVSPISEEARKMYRLKALKGRLENKLENDYVWESTVREIENSLSNSLSDKTQEVVEQEMTR